MYTLSLHSLCYAKIKYLLRRSKYSNIQLSFNTHRSTKKYIDVTMISINNAFCLSVPHLWQHVPCVVPLAAPFTSLSWLPVSHPFNICKQWHQPTSHSYTTGILLRHVSPLFSALCICFCSMSRFFLSIHFALIKVLSVSATTVLTNTDITCCVHLRVLVALCTAAYKCVGI